MNMKKNIIFIILLLIATVGAKANDGKVMLQSGGKVTFFDSSKINDAIAVAEEGDTIDLAAGSYSNSDVLINKNILLRGRSADRNGQYTQIYNNTTIESACRIEGIYFYRNINVTKEVSGLTITSCSFDDINFSADMPGMLIERSLCRGEMCLNNLKSKDININNCNLACIYGGDWEARPCTFRNCNIANVSNTDENKRRTYVDMFINCILETYNYYAYGSDIYMLGGSLTIVNSLRHCYNFGYDNSINDYYFDENDGKRNLFSSMMYATCSYTKNELLEKGYIGTDGTVIGSEGGAYPYTLTPINTRISSSTISMADQKISVDVEVKVE